MTTVPPPVDEDTAMRIWELPEENPEPPARWSKYVPGESQLRAAAFGTLVGLLVAVILGAAYGAQPGGSLWALDRTVFPTHAQDVAVRAVVSQLKKAQDILGNGKQPTPDQLTEARTSLNEAKRGLEFVSASDERTSLQNLYLQLTQQLRQYTPEQAQQLPALPAPAGVNTDANLAANVGPAAPASTPPSWGYAAAASAPVPQPQSYSVPPPPGIPVDPVADWPAPVAPPLTPNLLDLGGYDPSWSLLYGYNVLDWFNWGLSGFNRYGYDFMGFDRWGYDRWGYDRWGYDRWGYNWDGYNWSGYNRDGRDRDGRNEWGQFRDEDPRDQGWYDRYHPYRQYYEWKFQNTNPVFSRSLWDQTHGIDPAQYRDWNLNRNWDNPLERDWSPVVRVADRPALAEPVVNLDASLAQFIAADKSARPADDLIKDLSTKSVRNFSKELATPDPAPEKLPAPGSPVDVKPSAPPVLTVPAPTVPPKQVPEDFTPPSLPTVPPLTPSPSTEPRATSSTSSPVPSTEPSHVPAPTSGPPTNATTSAPAPEPTSVAPAPTPKDETSAPVTTPSAPTHETPVTPTPRQTITTPPSETVEPSAAPEPTKQRSTPTYEAPTSEAPAPRATVEPAPAETPAKQAPVERETAPSRASAPEPTREAPAREAPTYSTPVQAPSMGGGNSGGSGGGGRH
ncbi:hypothetical protein MYCSP_13360 [Mycobacteroides saopaulense]|uniref:hypothetical protein n=1 Tax=Mycobacteroides saopaulense TaxID=1578165 RepID=UPI000720B1ED|nr:hypothetical protein [Mycobacteroides saopaulense]ALR14194.1 hypothetical protein MYCSP_13360 [Mycobacteroides saopaulense]